MPKVTEEYRETRRHEIAAAALRSFARTGFEATTMADIIAESGLSAGAIYGHYKSKNELIQAVVSDVLGRRTRDVAEAMRADRLMSPAELIGRFISGMRGEFGDSRVLVQLWAVAAQDLDVRTLANGVVQQITDLFRTYLIAWHTQESRLSADDAEALADRQTPVCLGLAQGYIVQSAIIDDFDGEGYLAAASGLFSD
ncbi:TetR/AcrR family transcriptional regulator [Rathayibacter sp. YIM 133350]|uniref:TetR/AcrR family transcriptional regulator n=1 Tax=Rathayibacter sp. YIM 133350 TaxID=3131992 RepID=UPI00307CCA09